ncbi:mitochondrial folate carrier protein Flx1 [Aspergillus costaricaensis CBS 115574]|uniref:Mitochondrial folate carrier protein Flx1 n=1 Tax=Aspergillus costaricaensis CBS 115574 TaxID=1448317 RepID=A0ACD1HYF7_9EURO|nr:mitochondrial folate carrier protein Flx1 [Aspergillus costaricaensis CBS 115574]RAK83197.1 mitochondrial folate carrier protein Flx1 [Aspergillus costaricaensis CBS 115574]
MSSSELKSLAKRIPDRIRTSSILPTLPARISNPCKRHIPGGLEGLMTGKDGLSSSFVETVAGFTAGIASTLCLHPLDLLKTRLQVDRLSSSRVGGSVPVIREIFQNEGGIKAFYRGLTPNIVGNSTSWALYFLCYGNIKDVMRTWRSGSEDQALTSADYFLASGSAGMLTSALTNPIWVIKTRMLSTGSQSPGAYASFTTGAKEILRSEGIAGFYRGLVPALFGVSHGALQFMAYEQLKLYRSRMAPPAGTTGLQRDAGSSHVSSLSSDAARSGIRELGNVDLFVISSLSKLFAGCVTYPYQVLRSRLQTYDAHLVYSGVRDAVAQIWAREGITGFYKGLGPNLLRVLPSTWVTFLVYENTRAYLPGLLSNL